MNTQIIDFKDMVGPVYVGRSRGVQMREVFHLDELDEDTSACVNVLVPEGTYTVSSSFFLGLFGPSVVRLGSLESFNDKYHFKAPKHIDEVMQEYASRALQSKKLFS